MDRCGAIGLSHIGFSRLATECGVTISAGTLRNELKRMGYVWKRTRYSLKKSAIPSASSRPGTTSQN
ncbi:MAG: winged helix-turn-helix domain-containing protein [Methylobacter sp.]